MEFLGVGELILGNLGRFGVVLNLAIFGDFFLWMADFEIVHPEFKNLVLALFNSDTRLTKLTKNYVSDGPIAISTSNLNSATSVYSNCVMASRVAS